MLQCAINCVIIVLRGDTMADSQIIGNRIKLRRDELGLTQEQLASKLWLNKSTIQRYETGQVQNIKLPVLQSMAEQLNVDPNWLACKSDKKGGFDVLNKNIENYGLRPVKTKKFRMLGKIACGEPIFCDEDYETFIEASAEINADFCLTAHGDSMINARIYDGDVVFIKSTPQVSNGEIAAVIIDDEATLKRVYYYRNENKLVLAAENPKYPPFVYVNEELNNIRILGKATAFMSNIK